MFKNLLTLLLVTSMLAPCSLFASPSAALVGWGNALVPGLGATVLGQPGRGLLEATSETGLYFGGTYGSKESYYTLGGSVMVPSGGSVDRPLLAQMMRQTAVELHFYDTFYHYQQASKFSSNTDREKGSPQPLYQGTVLDELAAPFRLANLSEPWVYSVILASSAYLTYRYAHTTVQVLHIAVRDDQNGYYAAGQIGFSPFSAIGDEAFFRGFVQRELHLYTGSAVLAVLLQSAAFSATQPSQYRISSFVTGALLGAMVNHYDGNLEQAVAAHFWANVVNGALVYWQFRRMQGAGTPFTPPVTAMATFPF